MDYFERSLELHKKYGGKIQTSLKVDIKNKEDLSIVYTPGIARPCEVIAKSPDEVWNLTIKKNTVAIVSDGSSVLGLGNIGPYAALPVMEGKAMLFKKYANIDAWPICLNTQGIDEIISTVQNIAPGFGGINLEDIAAPGCFEIEARLQDLGIPVFHDDQHGTAIVLVAAMINAAKVLGRPLGEMKVVISGAGAAGTAIAKLLRCVEMNPNVCSPVKDVIVCDRKGAIHKERTDLNSEKQDLLRYSNRGNFKGSLHESLDGADVFIGVSKGNLIGAGEVRRMANKPVVFAMANPIPEIMPDDAKAGGAAIIGTGRSDYPNQINNLLAFPGIFRGALNSRSPRITDEMKLAAVHALANCVKRPSSERILPDPLDENVAGSVASAVEITGKARSESSRGR